MAKRVVVDMRIELWVQGEKEATTEEVRSQLQYDFEGSLQRVWVEVNGVPDAAEYVVKDVTSTAGYILIPKTEESGGGLEQTG